jgi:hypothetical protein
VPSPWLAFNAVGLGARRKQLEELRNEHGTVPTNHH